MTYEEAKDQIANKLGFLNWSEMVLNNVTIYPLVYNEAAELYARSKWEEACEAQIEECKSVISDEYRYDFKKPEFKP